MIRIYEDPEVPHDLFWFLATVHDSDLKEIPLGLTHDESVENIYRVLQCTARHMSHEFTYKGRSFEIGLDAKLGRRWAGGTVELNDFSHESISAALNTICR
jgi:hypothetical protein